MTDTLAAALVELQASLPHVGKNTQGQRSKYADLPNISRIVLTRCAELGLYFCARPTMHSEFGFVLAYELTHVGGETRAGFYPLAKESPQAMGGQITYARRYALLAITGVAPDDDDDDAAEAQAEYVRMRQAPPEVDEHGAATFAEQTRMLYGPEPDKTVTNGRDAVPFDTSSTTTEDVRENRLKQMFAIYRELKVTDKDLMLADLGQILGRPIGSRKDLTLNDLTTVNVILRRRTHQEVSNA